MLEGYIYSQVFKKDEAKTELSSEKVELSTVKELEKLFEQSKSFLKEGKSKAKNAVDELVRLNKEAAKLRRKMETSSESFLQAAKKLGLEGDALLELDVVQKMTEKVGEMQNAFARAANSVGREIGV